ncbi:hypothetical protein AB0M02_10270 [Actinoplanes sp. NPDC051861]|uniref:hypothetical protein n=1 Tax=Actinoplanes sp. NPDC051861 TaxID=3155170 RepID=UPI003437C7B6
MRRARRLWPLALGLILLGAGALGLMTLHQRADRIRTVGVTVDATVTGQHNSFLGRRFKVVRVEYRVGDRLYSEDLLDYGWGVPPGRGEQISLAVDRDRPSDVAGPDIVAGSPWRYWYQPVGFGGIVLIAIGLWRLARLARGKESVI